MSRLKFLGAFLLLAITVLIGCAAISASLMLLVAPSSKFFLVLIWIIPALLTLSFIAALFGNAYFYNPLSRIAYRITAVWMGLLIYLLLAAVITSICMVAGFGEVPGFIAYALACAVALYGSLHARKIYVKRISLELQNLPEYWKGKRIAFVSDLHLGQIHGRKFTQKVADLINAESPDIVLVGGDLFDGSVPAISDSAEPLRSLQAKHGSYFVTGNHEEFRDNAPFIEAAKKAGLTVLANMKVEIEGIQFVGVHYSSAENHENFNELFKTIGIDTHKPSILIKHEPSDVDVAREAGISLQLSGHTHHAQVWPFRFIPKRIYKGFDYGLKKDGAIQAYTSSGVGTWGPPIRVGTDSEIVILTIK
jgi:predicted MPP superfamily phosphohydrolase